MALARTLRDRESGAAAVELALVLPLLLALFLGIVEFGRGFNARVSLQAAVREGVRVWALTEDLALARDTTVNAAQSIAIDPASVTTTPCDSGQPTSLSANFEFTYLLFDFTDTTFTATGTMRCTG